MGNIEWHLNEVLKIREDNAKTYQEKSERLIGILENCESILSFSKENLWTNILVEKKQEENWTKIKETVQKIKKDIYDIGVGDKGAKKGDFIIAQKRAEREYINIGIVAAFRQGKSTMLRALLGNNDVNLIGYNKEDLNYLIPTSTDKTQPCTGTKINYINDDYTNKETGEKKTNCAVIEYYTEDDIIKSMIDLLKSLEDKNVYNELTDNDKSSLSKLRTKLKKILFNGQGKQDIGQPGSPKEALFRYVNACEEDFAKLGNDTESIPLETTEDKANFYKLVCFYKSPDIHKDETRSYTVLSTKQASIYKKFLINGDNPGKIRFLDTPGVGEARTSVEESLTGALRYEIDVAIAICKIDDANTVFINQFNDYIKKDFNKICIVAGKTYDIKDCFYYILNVSSNSIPGAINELKEKTIRQSLSAQIDGSPKVPGIEIEDDHIVAIDCKENIKYDIRDEDANEEGHNKNVTILSNEKQGGCNLFLINVLDNLQETIAKIDNYFNSSALLGYNGIMNEYNSFKTQFEGFKVPKVTYTTERNIRLAEIQKKIEIEPIYNEDTSDEKLQLFMQLQKNGIVSDFLKSKYKVESANIEKDNIILSNAKYSDFRELEIYSDIKINFREYFIEKLIECYDIVNIEISVNNAAESIAQTMIDAGLGEDIVSPNRKQWFEIFTKKYGSEYPILTSLFEKISNTHLASGSIEDYVKTNLNSCFHQEESHNDKNTQLFASIDDTRKLFRSWLEDIADDLIKNVDTGTTGIPSFHTIVDETKEKYKNRFSDLRLNLRPNARGYNELCALIEDEEKIIFKDIAEKKAIVDKWKNLKNSL